MIELSKNPNAPYLAHPRGPHFTLLRDEFLTEDADGNDSIQLALKLFLDYLNEAPDDKIRHEAVALLTNNNGMALQYHAVPGPHTVQSAWSSVGPTLHPDGSIRLDLHHVAVILAQNSFEDVKAAIKDILNRLGVEPNLGRIQAEFCKGCK